MPLDRPDAPWLATLGATLEDAEGQLRAQAWSASSMWAANAATVSPAPDSADGKCHLTVANLVTMPHRSHEWPGTLAQLRLAFADPAFQVHAPVPALFGDEGAANHMRLCSGRSEEHTSELQSLMRNSYAAFCLKKKNTTHLKRVHV